MEVDATEVEETLYEISSDEWKAEEKREYHDDKGRMWSAPVKVSESDESITVRRRYHRAGAILAEQMTAAGKHLGIRIPLAGEYLVGASWKETH